jgi:hypothetical protein
VSADLLPTKSSPEIAGIEAQSKKHRHKERNMRAIRSDDAEGRRYNKAVVATCALGSASCDDGNSESRSTITASM